MGYPRCLEKDNDNASDKRYMKGMEIEFNPKNPVPHYKCLYCEQIFNNKESVFSHIRQDHNKLNPTIFVNETVCPNNQTIYVPSVKSAKIHRYGYKEAIKINERTIDDLEIDKDTDIIDITKDIKNELANNLSCSISIGSNTVKIEKFLSFAIIDKTIDENINFWQNQLQSGNYLTKDNLNKLNLNGAEKNYLDGIFNYFLACQKAHESKYKIDRYYDANRLLKSFVSINSVGLYIRKIIAFKFNWFKTLFELCEDYKCNDDFTYIYNFFKCRPSCKKKVYIKDEKQLYIEDDILEIMNAIINFMQGNYESVKKYLIQQNLNNIDDSNLYDKILMLKYRMLRIEGKGKESRYIFNELKEKYSLDEFGGENE